MGQLFGNIMPGGGQQPPPPAPTPQPQTPVPGLASSLANLPVGGGGQPGGGLGGYLMPAQYRQYVPSIGAGAPQVTPGTWLPPRTAVPGLNPQSQIPGTTWGAGPQTSYSGMTPMGGSSTGQPTNAASLALSKLGPNGAQRPNIAALQAAYKANPSAFNSQYY